MTELSFAKQFLSSLDTRPARIPPDHVEDPRNYPSRPPYTLPKMPYPMKKRKRVVPGQEPSINVAMKSLRNPPLEFTLPNQSLSTSILSLKHALSEKFGIPTEKIHILMKKKPCPDSKALKDLVPEGDEDVDFSVMVIGGAAAASPAIDQVDGPDTSKATALPVAQGPSGDGLLKAVEFWDDLKGFLSQRLKSEAGADKVFGVFKEAWDKQNAMQP